MLKGFHVASCLQLRPTHLNHKQQPIRSVTTMLSLGKVCWMHLAVVDKLVHAPGPQRCPNDICHCHACIDVADQLWRALTRVCPFFQ